MYRSQIWSSSIMGPSSESVQPALVVAFGKAVWLNHVMQP
jgi:hypothetical protein